MDVLYEYFDWAIYISELSMILLEYVLSLSLFGEIRPGIYMYRKLGLYYLGNQVWRR